MIRYFLVLSLILISPAAAEELGDCGFIPKRTEEYQKPQWEGFSDCAFYENGVLIIAPEHMARMSFGSSNTAQIFVSGQYFYVKPDGSFLAVIFYENGADPFQEGLTRSLINGKIAYFNQDFEPVIAPTYDWGLRLTFEVQHRYAPELRWASSMTKSILMIVSRYPVCMQTGYLAARLAA